jgi:hypothetical protein
MAARTADCIEKDAAKAFMSMIRPEAEDAVMQKLQAQEVARSGSHTQSSMESSMDVDTLNKETPALVRANFTLGKLFALFRRMRRESNSAAYDYFEKISMEEEVALVLLDGRWEWKPRLADVLEGVFVKLVNARKVGFEGDYNGITNMN